MAKVATYDQDSFEGRDDDVGLNVDTWNGGGGTNGNWTQDVDVNFRIRYLIQETNGGEGTLVVKAQYKHEGADYTDITSGSAIQWATSSQYADDDTTTQLLGAGSFVAGYGSEADNIAPDSGSVSLIANEETEFEFVFTIDSAQVSNDDIILVRLLESDGTEFLTYTNTPTITVSGVVTTGWGMLLSDKRNRLVMT